jgi:hypothetical protein
MFFDLFGGSEKMRKRNETDDEYLAGAKAERLCTGQTGYVRT